MIVGATASTTIALLPAKEPAPATEGKVRVAAFPARSKIVPLLRANESVAK